MPDRNNTLAFLAVLLLGSTAAPAAGPTPVGEEFQVNTNTAGSQHHPSLFQASDGSSVIVWESDSSAGDDTSESSIQGRRFAADGSPIGEDFQVNVNTTSHQVDAVVSQTSGGSFVVIWGDYGSAAITCPVLPFCDTDPPSIQGQRFASSGSPVGAQFQVNTYTSFAQSQPSVAAAADGSFVVVWMNRGSGRVIAGQRYAPDGSRVGEEFQVGTTGTGEDTPEVSAAPDGSFLVVWASTSSLGDDSDGGSIQGQRYAADGSAEGGQFQVNTYTTGEQTDPAVSSASDGSSVVVWTSVGSSAGDTDNWSVQGQRYGDDGNPAGGQFQVNTYTTEGQFRPELSVAPGGSFVVAWSSYGSFGDDTSWASVQTQSYAADGIPLGGQFQVNTYTLGKQSFSALSSGSSEGFVVAWVSAGSSSDDNDISSIQARRFVQDAGLDVCSTLGLAEIFSDDFDNPAAEDPAWSVIRDPLGHLSGLGPGLGGTANGLEVFIDHLSTGPEDREHFVLDQAPELIADYCASFLFDPGSIDLNPKAKIYAARGDDGVRLLRVILREKPSTVPPYQIRLSALNDNYKWVNLDWVDLEDAEARIAIAWKKGTGAGDGEFRIYLDGVEVAARTGFNNDDRALGAQAVGNMGLFKPGTYGTLLWDEFKSFGLP